MKKILLLSVCLLALAFAVTACKGKSEIEEPVEEPVKAAPAAKPEPKPIDVKEAVKPTSGTVMKDKTKAVTGAKVDVNTGAVKPIKQAPTGAAAVKVHDPKDKKFKKDDGK